MNDFSCRFFYCFIVLIVHFLYLFKENEPAAKRRVKGWETAGRYWKNFNYKPGYHDP